MKTQTAQKISLALGVVSVATSVGNVAVKAGPALQTLNNLTNTAEFSINNTYGQSFSVDGVIGNDVTPFKFASAAGLASFNALTATIVTGFQGSGGIKGSLQPVSEVSAFANIAEPGDSIVTVLASLTGIVLAGATGTQTLGASISSTLFGPSTVKATSSFTNQLINDLSAF